jgi:hypothetical protein
MTKRVRARVPGTIFVKLRVSFEAVRDIVAAGVVLMFEFVIIAAFLIQAPPPAHLPSGTVIGVLRTNEGAPMTSVRVAVVPADNADAGDVLQAIVQTDGEGQYRIENVPPGRYHIMTGRMDSPVFHPGVDDVRRATTIVVADGTTTQVPEMVFVRTRVSGRVIDDATGIGRRIESLSICCDYFPANRSGTSEVAITPVSAQIHDDGTFEFAAVSPGNQYFQAFDPNIVSFNLPVTVGNTDQTAIELKVSSGSEVRAKITDQTGAPIGQAQVTLKPLPGNGSYELRGRPASTLMPSSALATGSNPLKPSADDIRSRLLSQAGIRVISLGANGILQIPGVLPGEYALEINPPGSYSTNRQIEVGSQATNLQIQLPFTQVAGKIVVSGDGNLPSLKDTVRVFVYSRDGRVSFCLPDNEGRFYQVLPSGEYRVEVQSLTSNYSVLSIGDGTHDLSSEPYVLDRDHPAEIRITIGKVPRD